MSLYRRAKSPFWWSEITYKGYRSRRSTGTTSRRDAEVIEKRFRDDLKEQIKAEALRPSGDKLTLDQACGKYWLEHGKKLSDARNEKRWLRYIRDFIGADTVLSEIDSSHVQKLVNARDAQGAGPAGVNRTLACLKNMMNRAATKWGQSVKVIDWKSLRAREPKARVRALKFPEAMTLLSWLREYVPHIAVVVHFLLLTGLRKAEVFNATWDKMDWDNAVLMVRVKGGYDREVPLEAEAMALLRSLPQDGRRIFDTTNARKHFDKALRACCIEDFHWHDLRHTHATWLGQKGVDITVISKNLGHSSLTVTMKYRHVFVPEVRAGLRLLPRLTPNDDGTVVELRGGK